MLDQLLHELLALIGQGILVYVALGAILSLLLWLVHVASVPVDRLERWRQRTAPQRTYTRADHVRGWLVVGSLVGLVGLAMHATVGLH